MRKLIPFFSLALLLLLIGCKEDPVASRAALELIPANSYAVTEIRTPQLLEKADFEAFKKSEVYQKIIDDVKKDSPFFAALLKDPTQSGVNLEQSMYTFSTVKKKNISQNLSAFLIPLADPLKFKEAMMEANNGNEPNNQNGISFYAKRIGIVAWNEAFAVIGTGNKRSQMLEMAEEVLMGNPENSLAQDKSLLKTLSKNHDVISWTSSNPYAENGDAKMGAAFLNFDPDALKDNYIYSHLDFEEGKIVGKSTFDFQDDLTDDFDLFFKDEVKTDFNKFIPKEDLTFAFSTAIDAKGINQVFNERPHTKSLIEKSIKNYDLTLNDIAKIFPGDLALAVYNMGDADNDAYGIFMMQIGDRDGLQKILDMAVELDLVQKVNNDQYVLDDELSDSFNKQLKRNTKYEKAEMRISDDKLIITANAEVLEGFTRGRLGFGSSLDRETKGFLQNHIFGGILNIDEIKLKDWEHEVPFGQLNFTTDRKQADFNLNFVDGNENSLKQILEFVNQVYISEKDKNNISF